MKKKARGVVLLEAFLALMLSAMAAYGLAAVNSVQFSQLAALHDANQAKYYAELEAQYLKQLGYEAVVDDNRDDDEPSRTPRYPAGKSSSDDKASNARNMTKFLGDKLGSEWKSTVTLGEAIDNIGGNSDNKIQNIVVSVYKTSDGANASSRASITLPLSSQSSGAGGEAIGTIVPRYNANFVSDSEKKKYLFCDGSTYNTSAYPKLYKVLGTNKLPNLKDRVLWGGDTGGTYREAGLPNIKGNAGEIIHTELLSGSFYEVSSPGYRTYPDGYFRSGVFNFDASLCSPIYGRSDTVQPPAMTVRFYIRAK